MLLREIKRNARMRLHERMFVPAYYLVPTDLPPQNPFAPGEEGHDEWVAPPGPYYLPPVPVRVRIHTKWDALGDMTGTNYHYAEKQEITPNIIFLRSEVENPIRNAIVAVDGMTQEAYILNNIKPADDITVTAEATRAIGKQLLNLLYPSVS